MRSNQRGAFSGCFEINCGHKLYPYIRGIA